jgi:hypothetical protein
VLEAHDIFAVLTIAVAVLAAAAGAFVLWRRRRAGRLLAHLLVLAQTVVIAQVGIGLLLLSDDRRAPERLHYLYGALALAAMLAPWLYAPRDPRRRLAWFVGASLVAAALAARAYMSGAA